MLSLAKIKEITLAILFPPLCLVCKKTIPYNDASFNLCHLCTSHITINTSFFCSICRVRLPYNKKTCHKNAQFLLGAATTFRDEIKEVIHSYKYQKWQRLHKPLSELLITYLTKTKILFQPEKTIVIPMPLHPTKLKERGFNQAELLAASIATHYAIPLITNTLMRDKETKTQTELKDFEMRKQNVADAFIIHNSEQIKNKNVILIDDVFTSGATMTVAVGVLKKAGARAITALVIAKT
ncbi:MAG: ComF family protein [bacterium]|nr:ComF family protein [bacterium]